MRKINKAEHLSIAYFDWISNLSKNQHPKYNSSQNDFYKDIVMNLLYCQKGICAYTEIFLADIKHWNKDNWKDGKYISNYTNKGQLDHFDPSQKGNNGWDWDNFFVVDSDTNMKIKNKKSVNSILKPDLLEYSPSGLLCYNWITHQFIPNYKLKNDVNYNLVKEMIIVLGLNFDAIIDARRIYFSPIEDRIKKGLSNYESEKISLYQFFTAFEMSKSYFEKLTNATNIG